MDVRCTGFNYKMEVCNRHCDAEQAFCKNHLYMKEYTEEMIRAMILCKGCKKVKFIADGKLNCEICANRSAINRGIVRASVILCEHEGCTFKKSKENKYCGLHQFDVAVDELTSQNKRFCSMVHRNGCREVLTMNDQFQRCESCRMKERMTDGEKRGMAAIAREEDDAMEASIRTCPSCVQRYPEDHFIGVNDQPTLSCRACRKRNLTQDDRRDKQRRRDNCRNSIRAQYTEYKKNAKLRGIDFRVSFEEYEDIVNNPCFYCDGVHPDRGFNGMDRKDSSQCYRVDNVVSCCKMCNYMKRVDLPETFYLRVRNILLYQDTGKRADNMVSSDYGSMVDNMEKIFYVYSHRANENSLPFTLTLEDVASITGNDCYLCGKESTVTHRNGIDRYDNDGGYELPNCRPCCRDCNFLKLNWAFDPVISHLRRIHAKHN